MPVENKSRSREIVAVLVTSLVLLGVYAVAQTTLVRDTLKSMQYQESDEIRTLRQDLALTSKGRRIFLATQPALESATSFNEHCQNEKMEVALLGCYVNDRIYIYEVTREDLKDSNKVTAAHELLHAAWKRMNNGEREKVKGWLEEVSQQQAEWAAEELRLYADEAKLEELYTRVGTKLREIPNGLEEHYKEYFEDRLVIVDFYENYQAPFDKLKQKNEEIKEELDKLQEELAQGQKAYQTRISALEQAIEEFNACAAQAGCFVDEADFRAKRAQLEAERVSLDEMRESLNKEIERNNNLVEEYKMNQKDLGELGDALNSHYTIHEPYDNEEQ